MNLTARIAKLEAVRRPFDIASMTDEEIRQQMDDTLQALGGRDAALAAMRDTPGLDPEAIRTVARGLVMFDFNHRKSKAEA